MFVCVSPLWHQRQNDNSDTTETLPRIRAAIGLVPYAQLTARTVFGSPIAFWNWLVKELSAHIVLISAKHNKPTRISPSWRCAAASQPDWSLAVYHASSPPVQWEESLSHVRAESCTEPQQCLKPMDVLFFFSKSFSWTHICIVWKSNM